MWIEQVELSGSQAIYKVDGETMVSVPADLAGADQIAAVEAEIARQQQEAEELKALEERRRKNWEEASVALVSRSERIAAESALKGAGEIVTP